MTASVRISAKCARALLFWLEGPGVSALKREVEAALAKSQRSSTVRKLLAAPKKEKKAKKRVETGDIREFIRGRSGGRCEACGRDARFLGLELDHFFPRRHGQSVESCWLIDKYCHQSKTESRPDAAWWLRVFLAHCQKHGYSAAAVKAQARLQWVEARGAP